MKFGNFRGAFEGSSLTLVGIFCSLGLLASLCAVALGVDVGAFLP